MDWNGTDWNGTDWNGRHWVGREASSLEREHILRGDGQVVAFLHAVAAQHSPWGGYHRHPLIMASWELYLGLMFNVLARNGISTWYFFSVGYSHACLLAVLGVRVATIGTIVSIAFCLGTY